MKTKWIQKIEKYDGAQLHSLHSYLKHHVLGDSAIAWRGPCEVSFEHMVDGEDLLDLAQIRGSDMVHFVIEVFDQKLMTGVLLQRLFASLVRDALYELSPLRALQISRSGDDLYWKNKKLSISIATSSPVSTLVHFAINVSNEGTPVPTASLGDLRVDPKKFAELALRLLKAEFESSLQATRKVKPVP